ncbi:hypothetical protein Dimus_022771 [Dionaea muscipula]
MAGGVKAGDGGGCSMVARSSRLARPRRACSTSPACSMAARRCDRSEHRWWQSLYSSVHESTNQQGRAANQQSSGSEWRHHREWRHQLSSLNFFESQRHRKRHQQQELLRRDSSESSGDHPTAVVPLTPNSGVAIERLLLR